VHLQITYRQKYETNENKESDSPIENLHIRGDRDVQASKVFGGFWNHISSQFHLDTSNVTVSYLYLKKYTWIIFPVASNDRVFRCAVCTSHYAGALSSMVGVYSFILKCSEDQCNDVRYSFDTY
jgi:hypothetical protein